MGNFALKIGNRNENRSYNLVSLYNSNRKTLRYLNLTLPTCTNTNPDPNPKQASFHVRVQNNNLLGLKDRLPVKFIQR